MDPNNPNNPSGAQPQGAQPGDDALGFTAAPKEEKYNTQYLTANLKGERRATQLIVVGIILAAVLGVGLWIGLMPDTPAPAGSATADTAAAPAGDADTAAKAHQEDAPAEAKAAAD